MRQRKKNLAQKISLFLSVAIFGFTGFVELLQNNPRFNNQNPIDPTLLESAFAKETVEDELVLNQTTSYHLSSGEVVALHYQAETWEVVTMQVTSDRYAAPTISIQTPINDSRQVIMISPMDGVTKICGFTFANEGIYTFTFKVRIKDTYTVQFESGEVCEDD